MNVRACVLSVKELALATDQLNNDCHAKTYVRSSSQDVEILDILNKLMGILKGRGGEGISQGVVLKGAIIVMS